MRRRSSDPCTEYGILLARIRAKTRPWRGHLLWTGAQSHKGANGEARYPYHAVPGRGDDGHAGHALAQDRAGAAGLRRASHLSLYLVRGALPGGAGRRAPPRAPLEGSMLTIVATVVCILAAILVAAVVFVWFTIRNADRGEQ